MEISSCDSMLGRKYFVFNSKDWGKVKIQLADLFLENNIVPLFNKVISKDKDSVYLMYIPEDDTTELANQIIYTYPWKQNGITTPDIRYAKKAIEVVVDIKIVDMKILGN